jgi:hypothetical protein
MGAGFGNGLAGDPIALTAVLAVFGVFCWALLSLRRLARGEQAARRKAAELEIRLNEAEAALAAEAHVLLIWRGTDERPAAVTGGTRRIRGLACP